MGAEKKNKKTAKSTGQKMDQARAEIKKLLADKEAAGLETTVKVKEVTDDRPSAKDQPPAATKKKSPEDFNSLYRGKKGNKEDMSKIDRRDPNRKKKIIAWIIVLLVVLLGVTLAGFYFFVNKEDQFSGEKIDLTVSPPQVIESGNSVTLDITITNNEAIAIRDAEVTVQWPSGFTFEQSTPQPVNTARNAWDISDLKSGAQKNIKVVGQVQGEVGAQFVFPFTISYVPANFNSVFQKSDSFSMAINQSAIDLDMNVPVKVVSGQQTAYGLTITNNSAQDFDNLVVSFDWPDDLAVSDFSQSVDEENTAWNIDTLSSDQSVSLDWQGVLSAEEGAMRELRVELGYYGDDGTFRKQTEESVILFVVNPQLFVTLSVNNTSSDTTADFGEVLNYSINYYNESQSKIENLVIEARLSGEVLQWDTLVDANQGVMEEAGVLRWDQSSIPDLAMVAPGDEGTIDFSIALKDTIAAHNENDSNYSIVSQAVARSDEVVDLENSELEVESDTITVKLNSRLDLRAEGRYYSDEYIPVGEGPLPPQVDQATTYYVYWYLQNNANEVTDVTVSAVVPKEVVWEDEVSYSAGEVAYDKASRTISWTINKIPPHVGQSIPELEASFALQVTPAVSDVGKTMILLGKSECKAHDSFTGEALEEKTDYITTALPNDPLASEKGLVVPAVSSSANANSNSNINGNTNTTNQN